MLTSDEASQGKALGKTDTEIDRDCQSLLERYRRQIRGMVVARLDRRLASRVDASDVVQDVFADAYRGFSDYARTRPIRFYPWLQQFAKQRLSKLHRDHLRSAKRSLLREQAPLDPGAATGEPAAFAMPVDPGTSPSQHAEKNEERSRILSVLQGLPPSDREVLELRYVHGLSFPEIALKLGLGVSAVKMRHFRALNQISTRLDPSSDLPMS